MTKLRVVAGAVCGLTVGILRFQVAAACTPPIQGRIDSRDVTPRDGATGVPLNARVVVQYRGSEGPADKPLQLGTDLQLRRKGGAMVPATITRLEVGVNRKTSFALRPAEPLEANAGYEVLDRRTAVPCTIVSGAVCTLGPQTVFAAFTTGSTADTTPPQFAGLESLSASVVNECDSDACCGRWAVRTWNAGWSAADDAVAATDVLYNVYAARGDKLVVGLVDATAILLDQPCAGANPLGNIPIEAGEHLVRAVDWAGNEDRNQGVRSIGACSSGGSDGAVAPPPADAAPGDVAPPAPSTGSGGCAIAAASSSPAPLALALFALLGLVARRRQL